MAAPLWGFGGMPPRKIWNFRHSEILSRAILQALHQSPVHCCSWGTKGVAQLGLEGSPVLELTSSALKYSMPEVHLEGFPALESTSALLSTLTQLILEVLFTKPSKDVCLIDIICSHRMHQACMCRNIRQSALPCMNINYVSRL